MADALHWVVAVRTGFTTESVQSTTAFSATFVAVRALGGAGWNQPQFACCTGHRSYSICLLCAPLAHNKQGVCSRSSSNSSRDVILPIPRSQAAPERGFVLMWRRTWAVGRAVAALNRAVGALNRRLPPYIGSVALQGGSRSIRIFCRVKQFSTALLVSRTTAIFRPPYIGHRPPYELYSRVTRPLQASKATGFPFCTRH